ncbi:hypothetical protein F4775DRAFT_599888 [Biscogniauxia sp. FL1348]|nr:hypothetical protein F4775DRAFT_599888 [Biscogniauxia sp. FL1348]
MPNLQHAAFGLGNSNYKYHNQIIDVAAEVLENRGPKLLLADDLFTTFGERLDYEERDSPYVVTLTVREDTSSEPIDLHNGVPTEQHASHKKKATKSSPITKPLEISSAEFSLSPHHANLPPHGNRARPARRAAL